MSMSALPETVMPEGPLRPQARHDPFEDEDVAPLVHALLRGLGVAAVMAALGVWAVPLGAGDPAAQLGRLLVSVGLLLTGAVIFSNLRSQSGPEVRIDQHARRLTILERGHGGGIRLEICHEIDALSEIVLRDGLLTARDGRGRPLLALPVENPEAEVAIRDLLAARR